MLRPRDSGRDRVRGAQQRKVGSAVETSISDEGIAREDGQSKTRVPNPLLSGSTCAGCGARVNSKHVTVLADNLTFFEGDLLCIPCARKHGEA